MFGALIVISCEDNESSLQNETLERNNKSYTVQANSSPEFSSAEKDFHNKILALSGNRMGEDFHNMTDQQREDYAINYLKEDSYRILKENGYTTERLSKELKSDLEVLHKALYYYSLKTNLNP